jgi:hypothetical protein
MYHFFGGWGVGVKFYLQGKHTVFSKGRSAPPFSGILAKLLSVVKMSGEATFNKPTFILCDNLSMNTMTMPVAKNKKLPLLF